MNTPTRLIAALGLALSLAACQTTTTPAAVSAPPAAAQSTDLAALQARVASFNKAFKTSNYKVVGEIMPPRLTALLAKRMGLSPSALSKLMVDTTENMMQSAKVHSSEMTVAPDAIKTAGGINYALLPTRTDITVMGMRAQQETTTVALQDSGQWYLVRVETAQHEADLKQAYPELKSVKMR